MDLSSLDYYAGRRVLVTGDTGFKGSWLCLWLASLGAKVTGVALPATEPSHFALCGVGDLIDHNDGDVRDVEALREVFRAAQPEVVFHLAAQSLVRPSYEDPRATFETNVGGTVNVLESARTTSSARAIVVVTSDKCYENLEWEFAYRECDKLGGYDPYSASKACAELVTAAYRRSFFGDAGACGVATARAGNVIGGGDWARDRLIPDCVRAIASKEPLVVRRPSSIRPWQHVLEPLLGYAVLGARLAEDPQRYGDAFNFGPANQEGVTVGDLVEQLQDVLPRFELDLGPPDGLHEARSLRLSTEKTAGKLGWRGILDTPTAVRWTADWYAAWLNGEVDLVALSRAQIDAYVELARRS